MPEQDSKPPGFVKFSHKRSGLFRVVHADGAWGNLNQAGIINLTLYSEHPAIPDSITYPLDENGNIVNTPSFAMDEGVQREMEVSVALSVPAAMQIRATLDIYIQMADENAKAVAQKAGGQVGPT